MELLGVGPGEILLILVIMLLVFGPERLPEFARQAGRFVVRVRDWIQRSPDAALVLRARAELESELQAIRAELTREVESMRQDLQSVRSDLADAGKLLEQSAQEAARVSKIELPDGKFEEPPSLRPPVSATAGQAPTLPTQSTASAPALAAQSADGAAASVAQAADSAVLSEFEVDPGPIGARRARIAEVSAARSSAMLQHAPTIAGGETVARGARSAPASPPAHVVPDDSPLAADIARIDALSRQVSSIAEELARLRATLVQRMAEEKHRQNDGDHASTSLNGTDGADGSLGKSAASPAAEPAPANDALAMSRYVESSS
ncbi:MAG: twin-arginine translocase TatA/TatE family subunit [Roseiflexus sp.]|nr:twin-arginine translocase TatA/TatE family subunit [Roseiflexus sp.]MCS7290901.1 twin-arginine translocase TatA/TatE family subunit [Roseiflexus sp.]MDW8232719.1 twin-arginine translocase TatA/TatE family subunit [Roseiflexaceae bacterium]